MFNMKPPAAAPQQQVGTAWRVPRPALQMRPGLQQPANATTGMPRTLSAAQRYAMRNRKLPAAPKAAIGVKPRPPVAKPPQPGQQFIPRPTVPAAPVQRPTPPVQQPANLKPSAPVAQPQPVRGQGLASRAQPQVMPQPAPKPAFMRRG